MDQIKIGEFIASERRAHSMTQAELAEKLYISAKTVSRWETGKGMPEVSLMIPLCRELEISVNELLSGQRPDGAGPRILLRGVHTFHRHSFYQIFPRQDGEKTGKSAGRRRKHKTGG